MRIAILALAALTTSGLGMMQGAPPIKMGLWESTSVTKTTMPPAMAAQMKGMETITNKRRACYTDESWERIAGTRPISKDCTTANHSMNGKTLNVTWKCHMGKVDLTTDATFTFDGAEAWHATGHSTSVFPPDMMGGGTMTSDTTSKATYLGASCGDVPPGKSVSAD